jgi:hypothetical protein
VPGKHGRGSNPPADLFCTPDTAGTTPSNDSAKNYQHAGETPLHDCSRSGHLDSVRLLLDHGSRQPTGRVGRQLAATIPHLEVETQRDEDFAKSMGPEKKKEYLDVAKATSTHHSITIRPALHPSIPHPQQN